MTSGLWLRVAQVWFVGTQPSAKRSGAILARWTNRSGTICQLCRLARNKRNAHFLNSVISFYLFIAQYYVIQDMFIYSFLVDSTQSTYFENILFVGRMTPWSFSVFLWRIHSPGISIPISSGTSRPSWWCSGSRTSPVLRTERSWPGWPTRPSPRSPKRNFAAWPRTPALETWEVLWMTAAPR